jgi:hypothetical protein
MTRYGPADHYAAARAHRAPRYSPGAYRTDTRYPCPTCHRAGALSAYEQARRYQCADCTRRDEAEY